MLRKPSTKYLLLGLCLLFSIKLRAQRLIIDTDGGLDDLMAVNLIIQHKAADLEAIVTVEGLASPHQAAVRMRQLLDAHQLQQIPVYEGATLPKEEHAFPAAWKKDNEKIANAVLSTSAIQGQILSLPKKFYEKAANRGDQVLALGPLTNLQPISWSHKNTMTIMGGAWQVAGNVQDAPTADSTNQVAEWNFYADTKAAALVLKSKATIHLIPLDATNQLPLQLQDLQYLREGGIAYQILSQMKDWLSSGTYYAWDPLAAAAYLSDSVVHYISLKAVVSTKSGQEGQLVENAQGNRIFLADNVCSTCFRKLFYEKP